MAFGTTGTYYWLARLSLGAPNQVLTMSGGEPVWAASASGFADPMTTRGDTIIRDATNTTARLAIGTSGQVLTSDGTDISWQAAGAATVSSVFTRTGAVVAATNDYTWAQIDKTTSSLSDITTKSHTALTDKGTNTHPQIDTHISSTSNPHSVSASDLSLGNVTNVATDDTAYNATSWNSNLDSATKNAIRDKIETMDSAITLNTAHSSSDGKDHSDVVLNNAHRVLLTTRGDILYHNATVPARLPIGTNGYVLTSDGTDVSWAAAAASGGDVVGPSSSTDNYLAIFDSTTGKLLKEGTNVRYHTASNETGIRVAAFGGGWFYDSFNGRMVLEDHNGVNSIIIYGTRVEVTDPIRGTGSESSPAFCTITDTDTGIYNIGSDVLGISCGGTRALSVSSSVVTFGDDVWTIPQTDGTVGQTLVTDGSGTATWGSPLTVESKAGDFTAENGKTYLVSSAAARAITMPAAAANTHFWVKDSTGNMSSNNFTFTRAGSESIEAVAANYVAATDFGSYHMVCDGTNWFIL